MADVGSFKPYEKVGGGRYTLLQHLGQGGMGVVWLAQDERLRELAALKFLPPEVATDPAALDDMRRETTRSHRLTHTNIVRIHDLHEMTGERPFIAMEYVDGPNLSVLRVKQRNRVFSWEVLQPLVQQLCDALEYAHSEKVIHRDLKPANMMLDSKGRLKLADFGIAAVASDSVSRVSRRHATSGTLRYMSPQQLDGHRPRSSDDIYSLGATLYELLTSEPPFYQGDIGHQIRELAPMPLTQRLEELEIQNPVPAKVAQMIMACLAKHPTQRPDGARGVAERIGLQLGSRFSSPALTEPGPSAPPASASSASDRTEDQVWPPEPQPKSQLGAWLLLLTMLLATGTFLACQPRAKTWVLARWNYLHGTPKQGSSTPDSTTKPFMSNDGISGDTNSVESTNTNIVIPTTIIPTTITWQKPRSSPVVRYSLWSTNRVSAEAKYFCGTNWYLMPKGRFAFAINTISYNDPLEGPFIFVAFEKDQSISVHVSLHPGTNLLTLPLDFSQKQGKIRCQPWPTSLKQLCFSDKDFVSFENEAFTWFKPGLVWLQADLQGHEHFSEVRVIDWLKLKNVEVLAEIKLEPRRLPADSEPWTNSLGMVLRLIPPPPRGLWAAEAETRREDFAQFAKANPKFQQWDWMGSNMTVITAGGTNSNWMEHRRWWQDPGFDQNDKEPVVGVNWHDAMAFCDWLTEQEQTAYKAGGKGIEPAFEYSLPTHEEWSSLTKNSRYPWGDQIFTQNRVANFATESTKKSNWPGTWTTFQLALNDSWPRTAPVKSLMANSLGLYDLAGNVQEWCLDSINAASTSTGSRSVRGGSWKDYGVGSDWTNLMTSASPQLRAEDRNDYTGFRIVLRRKSR